MIFSDLLNFLSYYDTPNFLIKQRNTRIPRNHLSIKRIQQKISPFQCATIIKSGSQRSIYYSTLRTFNGHAEKQAPKSSSPALLTPSVVKDKIKPEGSMFQAPVAVFHDSWHSDRCSMLMSNVEWHSAVCLLIAGSVSHQGTSWTSPQPFRNRFRSGSIGPPFSYPSFEFAIAFPLCPTILHMHTRVLTYACALARRKIKRRLRKRLN